MPTTGELYVRGEDLTPAVSGTVIHELTHALQDQHFDLDDALVAPSDGALTAAIALIEADATWVEQQWSLELSPRDRDEYFDEVTEFSTDVQMGDVPDVLLETASFPYVMGPAFHAALLDEGGQASLDRAFDAMPVSEEQILDPATYLAGDEPRLVEPPLLTELGEPRREFELGAFALFQMLATRLDYAAARTAVEGWGGGVARVYDGTDGQVCVTFSVTGDDPLDTSELAVTLDSWVVGLDPAWTQQEGAVTTLVVCDPADPRAGTRRRTETGSAVSVLMLRSWLISDMAWFGGLGIETAACVADLTDAVDRAVDACD